MRWMVWALAWGWALSACNPNVPEGRFACTDSSQCPPDWACRTDEGLCYRRGSESSPVTAEGGEGGDNNGGVVVGTQSGTGGKRAVGGSGGNAGRTGDAGRAANAGRAGDDAAGGSSGGGGKPAKLPEGCPETCSGDKPFCDGMSCVECLANSAPHCDGEQPVVCED
jgi:hypothetical protein